MEFKSPAPGKPSTTNSGSLPELIEFVPRMRMEILPPGSALVCVTCTPLTRPCKIWSARAMGVSATCSADTDATEPVRSRLRWVP